jgi:hypothetical protein
MQSDCVRWRLATLFIGATFLLGACSSGRSLFGNDEDAQINAFPTSYKSDILAGMHAYLNDPTGIRDAAISQPMLKSVDYTTRYVVCLQFNSRQNGNTYAGVKEFAAVFLAGHFDHFVEKAQEQCAGVAYAPFPELQNLPR